MKGMRIILVLVYVILIILLLLGLLFNCRGCSIPWTDHTDKDEIVEIEDDEDDEEIEITDNTEDVTNIGGIGNLKVTLQWNFYADIDLHIIEPSGEEIYFQHKTSATGGALDVDNTDGGLGSAENIFWENPPKGQYTVTLVYYAEKEDYPINQQEGICHITIIQKDQEPRHYTQRLTPSNKNEVIRITNITVN